MMAPPGSERVFKAMRNVSSGNWLNLCCGNSLNPWQSSSSENFAKRALAQAYPDPKLGIGVQSECPVQTESQSVAGCANRATINIFGMPEWNSAEEFV